MNKPPPSTPGKSNNMLNAEQDLWDALQRFYPDAVSDYSGMKSDVVDAISALIDLKIIEARKRDREGTAK